MSPTVETDLSWVSRRTTWFTQVTPYPMAGLSDTAANPKVFDFHGMTPSSAARKLERIDAARDMMLSAETIRTDLPVPAAPIGHPSVEFINHETETTVPERVERHKLDILEEKRKRADEKRNRQQPAPPSMPSAPTSEVDKPVAPATTAPTPAPGSSLLDMPETTGRAPGDSWTGTMPDNRPVTYTIPDGNGANTVDLEIQNPDGTVDRWRIARNDLGGLKHWHDDANGSSSYGERPTADGDWYFQSFRPGASTSGAPSSEFTAKADLSQVYTPSYDSYGNYLGTDVGVLNERGLYDNQHVDLYQNTTFTRTVPNAAGGLDSILVGRVDNTGHGWWADELDRRWDVYVDDNGNPARRRYDPATQHRSFVYREGANTKHDTIDSSGRIVDSLTFGPENQLLASLSRSNGLLIQGKPGNNGELEFTFRDEQDDRRGRLTYLPNNGMRLYYDDYEVVEYDATGQEVKRYNRIGDRSVEDWLAAEAKTAFLRAAGGAAEGIGGLTGANSYINMVGEAIGYNPHLATRDEVLTGLEQGLGSFYQATRYFHLVSLHELTMYRAGNQSLSETLGNIRPSFLAVANEESKLLIGTDWSGFSDNPGAALGSSAFGIASWVTPAKVPRVLKSAPGRATDMLVPPTSSSFTRWLNDPPDPNTSAARPTADMADTGRVAVVPGSAEAAITPARTFAAIDKIPPIVQRAVDSGTAPLRALPGFAKNSIAMMRSASIEVVIDSVAAVERVVRRPVVAPAGFPRGFATSETPLADILSAKFNAAQNAAGNGGTLSGGRNPVVNKVPADKSKKKRGIPLSIRRILDRGNEFDRIRWPYYISRGGANEVHVGPPTARKQYRRLDSYIPGQELVSRKHTQLGYVEFKTVASYLREFHTHYRPGTRIADTPSNRATLDASEIGRGLRGSMYLEVPPQMFRIPDEVFDLARTLNITIRDSNGKIYRKGEK
ncbi:hypothetical protein ABZV58_03285 [Nocardia sp. NPDC004654]|uniref:hypothetical protein n=1 Tax=Nocardia sp. NPDC004654 TaxID=3154776 RepID=UPI0033B7724F